MNYECTSLEARNFTEQMTSCGCFCNSAINSPGSNCKEEVIIMVMSWLLVNVMIMSWLMDSCVAFDRNNLTSHNSSDAESDALLFDFLSNRSQGYHQYCSGTWGKAWKSRLIHPAFITGGPWYNQVIEWSFIYPYFVDGFTRRQEKAEPIVLP